MTEKINLAEFTVDTNGVVTGLKFADSQTAQTSKRMSSSLDVVTTKLFSVRSAALKLAGAFGFAGIAFTAANAVSQLTKDLVSSTTWFKNAAAAVTEWYNAIIKGEDAVGKLSRTLGNMDAARALSRLRELQEQRRAAQAVMASSPNLPSRAGEMLGGPLGPAGMLGSALGAAFPGGPDKSQPAAVKAASEAIAQADREANKLITTLTRMGLTLQEIQDATGATFSTVVGQSLEEIDAAEKAHLDALRSNLTDFMNWQKRLRKESEDDFKKSIKELRGLPVEGTNPVLSQDIDAARAQQTIAWIDQTTASLNKLHVSQMDVAEAWADTAPSRQDIGAMEIEKARVDLLQGALSSAVESLGAAFAEGDLSGKKFLASLMQSVGQACFALAAMFAASAIAASTGIGAAVVQGTPAQLGAAAAGFFAAGVAASAIGAAAGGRSGGGSRHHGGGGFGSPAFAGGGGPVVNIHVHGSMIGTNENTLGRDLKRLIESAEDDGA